MFDGFELPVSEDRRIEEKLAAMLGCFLQKIALPADMTFQ